MTSAEPIEHTQVTLTVPARTEFLHLARLLVAGAAGEVLDVDEIEDVKIAVEELASMLIAADSDDGTTLHIELALGPQAMTVEGHRQVKGSGPVVIGELLETILSAVVDDHGIERHGETLRFRLEKRLRDR